jgi:hypothetical protein
MGIYHNRTEIKILRVATVADVRDLEERAPDEFDIDAVRKKALVVVQALAPDIVDGKRYKPEQNIAQCSQLRADDRAELLTALRAVGIQDTTMRLLGDALPALAKALPAVADEMTLFFRVLDGAPHVPLSFPTEALLAGLSIVCEAPTSTDQDRDRLRALGAAVMHLTDYGYSYTPADPSRAAIIWSLAVSRAGAMYGGLAAKTPTRDHDDATAMGLFLAHLAADLATIVAAVERGRRAPKPAVEIPADARIRGRNLQLSFIGC